MTDIFQFYNGSASAAPGKGTGESGDPSKYAALRTHEGWRRVLSNGSEIPFVWKGITWKTAEHAYRAWHLETKNPELFLKSATDLSKASPIPNEEVLKSILEEKFTQNPEAKEVLQLTGDAELWYAQPKAPKVRWTFLEDIRTQLRLRLAEPVSHINQNVSSTTEMSKAKQTKTKRIVAQGGATMPSFVDLANTETSLENTETTPVTTEAGDTVTAFPASVVTHGVEEAEARQSSKKSAIRFCTVCDNYLYLQVEGETQTLQRICRNCGFKDTEDQGGLVSEMHIEQRAAEGYTLINEFTLKDKRLPHLHNTMKCINAKCPSSLPGKESDIVYIKYDTENLRYIYMCYICEATWRSRR
jgi:hypothetical protein